VINKKGLRALLNFKKKEEEEVRSEDEESEE
jgi:hypothetical protein